MKNQRYIFFYFTNNTGAAATDTRREPRGKTLCIGSSEITLLISQSCHVACFSLVDISANTPSDRRGRQYLCTYLVVLTLPCTQQAFCLLFATPPPRARACARALGGSGVGKIAGKKINHLFHSALSIICLQNAQKTRKLIKKKSKSSNKTRAVNQQLALAPFFVQINHSSRPSYIHTRYINTMTQREEVYCRYAKTWNHLFATFTQPTL